MPAMRKRPAAVELQGPVSKRPAKSSHGVSVAGAAPADQSPWRFSDKPIAGGATISCQLQKCIVCGSKLKQRRDQIEEAKVLASNGLVTVRHEKKRCQNHACGASFGCNYTVWKRQNVNFITRVQDFNDVLMVNSKVGFSITYLQLFWQRTCASGNNFHAEGRVMNSLLDDNEVVPDRTWKGHLSAALFYLLRVQDIEAGTETQVMHVKPQTSHPKLNGAEHFYIDSASATSPLYSATEKNFVIFSAARDDPDFDSASVSAVVTDGNAKNSRKLTKEETSLGWAARKVGKPRGTIQKKPAGHGDVQKKPACHDHRYCKGKEDVAVRTGRTGGIYLTMQGNETSSGCRRRILELREMSGNEDNQLKEQSLRDVKTSCPRLQLFIHDLACRCSFADAIVRHRMLDKFHARNHVEPECRKKFNPGTKKNQAILKKFRVENTSTCEQIFRFMNLHFSAQYMSRANYRTFWRHLCIHYNCRKI